MSATGSQSAIARLRSTALQVAAAVLVVWGLSWAFGRAFGPIAAVVIFVGMLSLALAVTRVGEFSVPFAISGVAVLGVLLEAADATVGVREFLPAAVAGLNGWVIAAYSVAAITAYWALDARVISAFRRESRQPEAANPDTVARAVQRRWSALLKDWRGIFAAGVFLVFVVVQTVFGVFSDAGAQVFAELAQYPLVSGFGAFILIAYTNLGGTVPVVSGLPLFGTLTAGEVLGLGLGIMVLAYYAREAR